MINKISKRNQTDTQNIHVWISYTPWFEPIKVCIYWKALMPAIVNRQHHTEIDRKDVSYLDVISEKS